MSVVVALLILNGVIIFHEFGHYLFARVFGIEVLEFAVGFGPKLFSFKKNGTRFAFKAFLVGGSCLMKGEQTDDNSMGSFSAVPVWQRAIVIGMGPGFNVFLALITAIIYICCFGVDRPVVTTVYPGSPAAEAGLVEGDRILSFGGKKLYNTREYMSDLSYYGVPGDVELTFSRSGEVFSARFPSFTLERFRLGFSYDRDTAAITRLEDGGGAQLSGAQEGDIIKSIDGHEIGSGHALKDYLSVTEFDESPVEILCDRSGEDVAMIVYPVAYSYRTTGFELNTVSQRVVLGEIIDSSYGEICYYLRSVFYAIASVFDDGFTTDVLAGPVGTIGAISDVYSSAAKRGLYASARAVLSLITLISASIGITNLVPLPSLDGCQLVFFAIEAVRRKPVSVKIRSAVNVVGFGIIMAVLLYVSVMEVFRLF